MDLQPTIVGAIITAAVTATGVAITLRNRRSDRVKRTYELYNQFFALSEPRTEAWFWLEALATEAPQRGFEALWRNPNAAAQKNYHALYKVLGFWFLVHRLFTAGQLEVPLARSLLGYEFYYWQKQVYPLVERTQAIDRVFPDVLEPFETIDWLLPPGTLPSAARAQRS